MLGGAEDVNLEAKEEPYDLDRRRAVMNWSRTFPRLPSLQHRPPEVMFRLVLRNCILQNGGRLYLTEYRYGETWEWIDRQRYPVETEAAETTLVVPSDQLQADPFAVAYQLVERFASLFDMPAALLPFVAETDGTRRVDVTALDRR